MKRLLQYTSDTKVRDIASNRSPVVLPRTATIADAVAKMAAERTGCVLVIDPGAKLVGILTERDVLVKVVAHQKPLTEAVATHMTPNPVTIGPDETLRTAITRMDKGHLRHLPVVEDGKPLSVLSVRGLVRQFADLYPAQVLNLPPDHDQIYAEREGA